MSDPTRNTATPIDPVGLLASEVLKDLYRAVCGREVLAVRAYQDEDAILLLVRFDPNEVESDGSERFAPALDTALLAMPGMIASAVEARTGRRLAAGNLSVCAERGLAVFAFSALDEPSEIPSDEDPFRIDAGTLSAGNTHQARLGR
jgi:hypothetical protein